MTVDNSGFAIYPCCLKKIKTNNKLTLFEIKSSIHSTPKIQKQRQHNSERPTNKKARVAPHKEMHCAVHNGHHLKLLTFGCVFEALRTTFCFPKTFRRVDNKNSTHLMANGILRMHGVPQSHCGLLDPAQLLPIFAYFAKHGQVRQNQSVVCLK